MRAAYKTSYGWAWILESAPDGTVVAGRHITGLCPACGCEHETLEAGWDDDEMYACMAMGFYAYFPPPEDVRETEEFWLGGELYPVSKGEYYNVHSLAKGKKETLPDRVTPEGE